MVLVPNPEHNLVGDVALVNGSIDLQRGNKKYTFSGISLLSPELFNESKVTKAELWDDFLKPAAAKGLVSGELYEGAFENLNTMEDVERLDASLGEE